MKLKYENEELPDFLKNKNNKCEIHCYDSSISYKIVDLLEDKDILRISAYKVNQLTDKLYASKQTFFVGEDSNLLRILDDIISANNIRGAWVNAMQSLHWNDYYDIEVSTKEEKDKLIKYHQTIGEGE